MNCLQFISYDLYGWSNLSRSYTDTHAFFFRVLNYGKMQPSIKTELCRSCTETVIYDFLKVQNERNQ